MTDIVERLEARAELEEGCGRRTANPNNPAVLMTEAAAEIRRLREQCEALHEALKQADDAIKEMFRYFDGGETRGSYDGRPERDQLRKAGYRTSTTLTAYRASEKG